MTERKSSLMTVREWGKDVSEVFPDSGSLSKRIDECNLSGSYWYQDMLELWDDVSAHDKGRYYDAVNLLEARYPDMSNCSDRQVEWHQKIGQIDAGRAEGKIRMEEFHSKERIKKQKKVIFKGLSLFFIAVSMLVFSIYNLVCNAFSLGICS